jgi:hypothetical protein
MWYLPSQYSLISTNLAVDWTNTYNSMMKKTDCALWFDQLIRFLQNGIGYNKDI